MSAPARKTDTALSHMMRYSSTNPAAEADQAAIQAEADYYLRSFEEMFDATALG